MSTKEKLRFYEIAHGPFRESMTILDLEEIRDPKVLEIADTLGANLFKLVRSVNLRRKRIREWGIQYTERCNH